jgi:hypothetical protein
MRDYSNLAVWDRTLRIALGLAMLAVGWLDLVPGLWAAAFQLFGWFPLVTGIAGWCPGYVLLGCRTRAPRIQRGAPSPPPGGSGAAPRPPG